MNISFKRIMPTDAKIFELMEKWDNDDEIKYFSRPNFNEGEIKYIYADSVAKGLEDVEKVYCYLILCDDIMVGSVSVQLDFEQLYNKDEKTAWISISIGEKEYRSIGIGEKAILFIEEKCKELNCNRIELGVFEFNSKAHSFYTKLGYKDIAEIKEFTYYDGKWQSDIRMEKNIR